MRKGSFALTAIAGLVSWSWSVSAETTKGKPDASAEAKPEAPANPAAHAPASPPPGKVAAPPATKPATKPAVPPAAAAAPAAPTTPAAPTPAGPPAAHEPGPSPDTEEGTDTESTPGSEATPPVQERPPAPAPGTRAGAPSLGNVGLWPAQTPEEGTAASTGASASPGQHKASDDVLAEDWWSHARPVFEIHGFFRTRAELFQNFSLGRLDAPDVATWPRPADDAYVPAIGSVRSNTSVGPQLCTPSEAGGSSSLDNAHLPLVGCNNKTQAGANMRFRLDPELHISDNLRVVSQIDILDNVVLGSTPSGYAYQPAVGGVGGYQVAQRNGYTALGVNDTTSAAPQAGVNSLSDSIRVKRVWAEYTTPVGELRFGRMPDNFGLGMVHNSGDGYDDDYQSTIDRLQFITAIKPLDLYFGGMWDFPNEGVISQRNAIVGQPYDLAQLDDVNQWSLILMRKQSPELTKTALAHDQIVLNGGAYVTLRKQLLADDQNGPKATAATGANVPDATPGQITNGFTRRNANLWIPDLWLQLRYKKFRFEAEGAAILGSMDSDATVAGATSTNGLTSADDRKIREFGLALQMEQRLVEDKLRLGFDFGWASGDANAYNTASTNNLIPGADQQPINSNTISTFRFNPAYRVDLILNRNLLQRIQGTYFFKPSVEYDFMRKTSGQRLGGGAGVIWTRASEFVQTPGHARDLGIELDGRLYFQSKDGGLNDVPGKMGGFYAMLEYGVLFPLSGLGYQAAEKAALGGPDVSAAQIVRLYLGVLF